MWLSRLKVIFFLDNKKPFLGIEEYLNAFLKQTKYQINNSNISEKLGDDKSENISEEQEKNGFFDNV